MLKELVIKNFKSIRDEIFFTMEADDERVSEFPNHIIDCNDNKLLKVASMYGPNGGGKTNILLALKLVRLVVINNIQQFNVDVNISCKFCDDDVISETLFFVTDKYEIGYSFEVVQNVNSQNMMDFTGNKTNYLTSTYEFKSEEITFRTKNSADFVLLLKRDEKGTIFSDSLDSLKIQYAKVINANLSSLNYLYNTFVNVRNINNVETDVLMNLYQEIYNIYELEVTSVNYNVAFNAIKANKDKLIGLLSDVDIKISDIIIDKNDRNNPIKFERIVRIGNLEEKKYLPLSSESQGTKKIFWMFLNLLNENNKSHIYYCDDMNAFLHPKLFKAIIEFFNSDENNNNQLIFNSHDIINMTNELFRRDEIWFVYRDSSYATQIIPLSSIVNYKGEQVRKDAKYYKQYLEGRYGADPFIKKGLSWNE